MITFQAELRGLIMEHDKILEYYKRKDIQNELLRCSSNKEVVGSFNGEGYSKRPDMLKYPNDITELVKQGITSFHISEETWKNPLQIDPLLKKNDLNNIRLGWDLILDVDCKFLEYSKIATDLIIKALEHNGINAISCKFSGNHGFHIGVPFESFPETVIDTETRLLFPDAPRAIAAYLKHMIKQHLAKKILELDDINTIMKKSGKSFNELVKENVFDPFAILELDTILISTRHLYRAPYSFNEKAWLISVPINPKTVVGFDKEDAKPENVKISQFKFMDRSKSVKNEARQLIIQAFDFNIKQEELKKEKSTEYEEIKQAIPEQFFPPCIQQIAKGLPDGRKRSLFILINFLTSVGWNYDEIEKYLRAWNKKNDEELREVNLIGQIRYHKQQKKKILPPNCSSTMYYKDIRICKPDKLCEKIKNPVNYSKIKVKRLNQNKPQKEK